MKEQEGEEEWEGDIERITDCRFYEGRGDDTVITLAENASN